MKIEKIIEEAWSDFKKYYERKTNIYKKSLSSKESRESFWICWNEYDLMMHLSRYLYNHIRNKYENIEIHLEKKINYNNFSCYDFSNKLEKMENILGYGPKIDLIIVQENSLRPFLLCIETKCYHNAVEGLSRGRKNVSKDIKDALRKIITLKRLGITEKGILLVFDDYYYLHDIKKSNIIRSILSKSSKQDGIKTLYYTSKAKIK